MAPLRLTILVLCLSAPAAALAADGGVSLYLQPLPPDASRLNFTIASVSAVSAVGAEFPLKLNLKTVSRTEAGRQRLLASGRLPAGSYAGFTVTITRAGLKGEQGEASLDVTAGPVRLDFPFAVAGERATLFWLTLKYQESVSSGFSFSPAFSIVVPPRPIAGHAGFVTNSGSGTITVFDKHLMMAVALIDTCAGPAGMALDQQRRRLYVACSKDDEILSIDVTTGEVVERTRVSPGDRPREIALTPDGLTLVSVNAGSNSVSVLSAGSLSRQDRIDVGSGPGSVLIDPAGRRAFVFNTFSNSVSVVDLASRSLAATVSTEAAPLRGQFNARGDRLYVIHERSPYMTVMDPKQLSTVTRSRVRSGVGAIAVDPVRGLISLGAGNDAAIEFYEPNALLPLYSMKARAGVSYMRIDGEDGSLYLVNPDARSLMVGRLSDRKIYGEIDVGDAPYWVAVMGEK